jgi:hypothetical protein
MASDNPQHTPLSPLTMFFTTVLGVALAAIFIGYTLYAFFM